MEFGEWLCQEVVKAVPHRHAVLSIPNCGGIFFTTATCFPTFPPRRDGWEALKAFYTTGVRDSKAVHGAVVAIQTFGDFFRVSPPPGSLGDKAQAVARC